MSIKKSIFKIFNGSSWDEYYHKTSADQVVYTKPDGTASNVQTELAAQNSAIIDYGTSYYTEHDIAITNKNSVIQVRIDSPLKHSIPQEQVISFGNLPQKYAPTYSVIAPVFIGYYNVGTILIHSDGLVEIYSNQVLDSGYIHFNTGYIKT